MAGMAAFDADHGPLPAAAARFATTRWSLVAAVRDHGTAEAKEALAALCSAYWYPLYAFIRRRGYPADEAQDLTQGFFASLLERDSLAAADQARGKFRSFLLASCNHYLAHERERARAGKRGGGRTRVSLDFGGAEERYGREPAHALTAEKLFDRHWALALLDGVLTRLRQEWVDKGKGELFDRLRVFLLGEKTAQSFAEVAEALGSTEGAVKTAAHRLRSAFRDRLREEIARTVNHPDDVEEEIRDLFAALAC
jgi:RNA polymerase sigma-70 factor (ECF subfamily)